MIEIINYIYPVILGISGLLIILVGCFINIFSDSNSENEPPLLDGFIRVHCIDEKEGVIHDLNKEYIKRIKRFDDYTLIEFTDERKPMKVKEKLKELPEQTKVD